MNGNEVIYQVFLRNYSLEGTFDSLRSSLKNIKDLGVDIIYLTPIHPISFLKRKGNVGSPYAIRDYFAIDDSYGNKRDLINLINDVHNLDMKIILDMVFNHTGRDNVLLDNHPEYYFYKNGETGNRVGDWSDIIDLDTSRYDTKEYLLSVLKYWSSLSIDGFRFDVASMIPLDLFIKARKILGKDKIFIGESIDYDFRDYLLSTNEEVTKDEDMFICFDALYNYSWFRDLERYISNQSSIDKLIDSLNKDSELLKDKGIRLNCLENHDTERIASRVSKERLFNLIDFISYIKGEMFIYMGQEYGNKHRPDLFEKDPVVWDNDEEIYNHYKRAIEYKKKQPQDIYQRFEKVKDNVVKVLTYKDNKLLEEKSFTF